MITAMVMLNIERGKINEVAEKLSDMNGIAEVYSVSGRFDLISIIRVENNDRLADIVTNHMLKVEDILKSETMLAFKCYSRHDLERMFSIGID
ncbi:MAG: Lrp/AsnC ligand binding domain-containing protein [Desulfobacterales bacterium]|jgi:DNA-binding Lrp family transcriptional regulator|nr:Lrp/AsnC ligand binding domain-containing protein [Desulfobacteraceae bacterium]MBT7698567.1 Lrp/AsnC ligand binding domain-containing protein [Desulfobacterales bacterium]